MFSSSQKNLKAATLAEVLVVLAIAATTLVSIAQITVQLLITVKNNEIVDYTTGISIQALEVAKNAEDIIVTAPVQFSRVEGSYSIDLEANPAVLSRQQSGGFGSEKIIDCPLSSPYYIEVDIAGELGGPNPNVCLQIQVRQTTSQVGQQYYEIEATTVTVLGNETRVDSIIGYRRGEFDIQTR